MSRRAHITRRAANGRLSLLSGRTAFVLLLTDGPEL
jgi:hypothetical protein